ncbi:MAG: hypothetical protein H0V47_14725, partial [Chloroflexia bacterium]|nr:hypothetical protein [Chloroflexia bacterium]
MKGISIRSKRIVLLLGLFLVSFALYFAAESGSRQIEIALLGALAALMLAAVIVG